MSEYICPDEIVEVFNTDPGKGRTMAVEWLRGLDAEIGDKIWLPEVGWHEKTAYSA